jgi:hypothetical protein
MAQTEGIQVKVDADISGLEKGMLTAAKATAAFAATVTGLATGLAAAVKSVVNTADEMTKAAQKTGIAMDELQKLSHVAKLSGVSSEQLQGSIGRLTKGMADFAKGGASESAKAIKAVGVEVKNSDGTMRSSSDVLGDIAEKFSRYRDGAEKSALALAIFGRAGLQMIPMLNGGKDAVEDARKELQDFGAVASDQLGKDSERLNDNLSRIGTFFTGIATQVAEKVVPAIANLSDGLVRFLRESGAAQAAGELLSRMFENLESIVVVTGATMAVVFGPALIASIAAVTKAIAVGLVGALALVAALVVSNPITALFVAGAAAAGYFGSDVIGIIKTVANTIIGAFRAAAIDIEFVYKNLGNIVGAALVGIVNSFLRMVNSMVNGVKSAVNALIGGLNKIGVKLDLLDTSSGAVEEIANNYADALAPALAERNAKIGEATGADYIGGFVTGIKNFAGTAQSALGNALKPPAPTVSGDTGEGATGSEQDDLKKLRERLERRLEVIRQSVLTEEQLEIHKYQKAQALALQAFELDMKIYADNEEIKLQKTREYNQLKEDLHRTHLEKLAQLDAAANSKSLNNLASFFSGAQSLAQSNGNKSFKTAKAFAIAQAVLSTTAAAIQAMADPTAITPFQKFANYAAVLGKGLAAVASIRSMQPSGGGGGGGSAAGAGGGGSGGTAASGGEAAGRGPGGNSVYINLQGQSFGRDQVRDLVKQIADFQKDGGQVVFA